MQTSSQLTRCYLFLVINSAGLGSSLCSLGADPTENTISKSTSIVGRFRGNVFTKPLPSNGRFLWLHYSGLQGSCHNILLVNFGVYGTTFNTCLASL
jgi:hypothetical protein